MKRTLAALSLLAIVMWQDSAVSQTVTVRPIVPNVVADRYIPVTDQRIEGFLGYRMTMNLEKRLLQIDSATLLSGFVHRPGAQVWIGEHVGKFLFSASHVYMYNHDERLKRLADDMVSKYITCQLPNGYLGTYLPKDYWTEWDVWAHKYAIIGLLSYYSVTGYRPALEAARKAGDLICRVFGDSTGQRDLITAGYHAGMAPGSILEPMVDLYRYTGDSKYMGFCKYILRAFEHPNGPHILSNLEKYGKVTRVGDAKAYEMMSCFLGILKYYKLTGDDAYLRPLLAAWEDIHSNRLYITGTSSEHENFQDDHMLPAENSNNMGEGCVTVTWIQFNLQLLQITGEPRFAEELERSVYNHLPAAENPQTGCVSYYTALQGVKPYRCDQGYSCCLSSVPRGISLIPDMIWGKIKGSFSVLMYEKGEATDSIEALDHTAIVLKINAATSFPFKGEVVYTLTPSVSKQFVLQFRVPSWSEGFVAQIGNSIYTGKKGEMLRIDRKWKPGDRISVRFQIPLEVIPGGPSYPNKIAFQRGPQILAVDSVLNGGLPSGQPMNREISLKDPVGCDEKLPPDWGWRQAYSLDMRSGPGHSSGKLILVPFSEAGQKESPVMVWIDATDR